MASTIQSKNQNILQTLSTTPYLAWGFSGSLIATGIIHRKDPFFIPSKTHCALFGALMGAGGFMIYDNDIENGAAFSSVWSGVYTIAHFKSALTRFKLIQIGLTSFAFVNFLQYGKVAVMGV